MAFGLAERRLVSRGQRVVEVEVGPPIGYALLAEDAHARIVAEATSAAAYRRAVMRAAAIFSRDGFRMLKEAPDP